MTNQITYASATPAEFEIKNSIVGNKGYFPHKRERMGEEESVPFVVAGEGNGKRRTSNVERRTSNEGEKAIVSRTDQPREEFDVHTPGRPRVAIILPTGLPTRRLR